MDRPQIIIGTTPTVVIEIEGESVDLSGVTEFLATIEQSSIVAVIEAQRVEVEGNYLSVSLRQEDTLRFREGEATMQVNWKYPDGLRGAIEQMDIEFLPNSYRKVMT